MEANYMYGYIAHEAGEAKGDNDNVWKICIRQQILAQLLKEGTLNEDLVPLARHYESYIING